MKSAYTLVEVVGVLAIIAITALTLFGVLGNVLTGMNKVEYESKKNVRSERAAREIFLW